MRDKLTLSSKREMLNQKATESQQGIDQFDS